MQIVPVNNNSNNPLNSRRRPRHNRNYIMSYLVSGLLAIFSSSLLFLIIMSISNSEVGKLNDVSLNGKKISVYSTRDEANQNQIIETVGQYELKINSHSNIGIKSEPNVVVNSNKNSYTLDLSGLVDKSNVMIEIIIGGDGSFVSERLSLDVSKYYLSIIVDNPDMPNLTSNISDAKVFFGEEVWEMFDDDSSAYNATIQNGFTIPVDMAQQGIPIRAEATGDVARLFITVYLVDDVCVERVRSLHLNKTNDWQGFLNVSEYAGHQVTVSIRLEDQWAHCKGYYYVSFFVPKAPTSELQAPSFFLEETE